MAILSTNQRLINVGDSYSAGNGIDITNNIISVTGDNAPYSAGDNIDIQDHIISGKDWSNDIEQASANAYNVTTAWVQDNYANSADMTYISAMVDTKLDTSAWSSVSGDLATESYVIMADNINYAQATAYVENQNYANKDFVLDNIDSATSGKLDSSSFASVSGDFLTTAFGISESGAWNEATNCVENNSAAWFDNQGDVEVNELVYAQSANWNEVSSKMDSTAFDTWQQGQYTNDIAGLNNLIGTKLDSSSFADVSGTFYPTSNPSGFITGVDLTPYYTTAEANTLSSMLSGAIDFVSANADDPEVTNLVQTNSGVWNEVTNKLDTTAFSDVSGTFLTAHQSLDNYYTKDETSGKEELANAFANIPVGDPEVNAYVTSNSASIDESTNLVQSNSSTWNDVTVYQSNSANYLTAHQSLDGYATQDWVTAQGYITGVDLTPYYTTADANTLSSMLSGAIDYVSANAGDDFPASADEAIQAYQTYSSTYLTAHQSLDDLMSASLLEYSGSVITAYDGHKFAGEVSGDPGDPQVNQFVYDNSARINDVNTSYENNSGTFLTAHQAISAEEWNDCYDNVNTNSGAWGGTPLPISARDGIDLEIDNNILYIGASAIAGDIANKLDTTAFSDVSATFLTGVDLSNYYTKSETSGADEIANAIASIPTGDPDVNNYVVSNSATIDDVVSTYQGASGTYLTAHQELTGYVPKSDFDELKQSYDALSSLFATYSGQWLLPNEGV